MPDPEPRHDRRVRRTRRLLHDTAIRLALVDDYERLTIDDILAAADVSRPTLYAHYRDKWCLLDSALAEALDAIREATEALLASEHGAFGPEPMGVFFAAAAEQADAMRVLLRGTGHARPLQSWTDELAAIAGTWFERQSAQMGREPRVPLALITRQFAWSVVATLGWWLEERAELAPAEVSEFFRTSTLLGRAWAMNLDGVDLQLP